MRTVVHWMVAGCLVASCGTSEPSNSPVLAPAQPNGSSALASAMVAMDDQLQATLESVMADPNHAWEGRTLRNHELLALEPTAPNMVNAHFRAQAPLYALAIEQFNESPSADRFNAVVDACTNCHLGTCPGPIERIEKRTWTAVN